MSTEKSLRLTIEIEPGADPIRGSIEQLSGSRRHFWGWLELIEALRRAAADQSDSTLTQSLVARQLSMPEDSTTTRKPQLSEEENS